MRSDGSRLLLRAVGVLFAFLLAGVFSFVSVPFLSGIAIFLASVVLIGSLCALPLRGMVGGAYVVFGVLAFIVGTIYAVTFFDGMWALFFVVFLLCCYGVSSALRGR